MQTETQRQKEAKKETEKRQPENKQRGRWKHMDISINKKYSEKQIRLRDPQRYKDR